MRCMRPKVRGHVGTRRLRPVLVHVMTCTYVRMYLQYRNGQFQKYVCTYLCTCTHTYVCTKITYLCNVTYRLYTICICVYHTDRLSNGPNAEERMNPKHEYLPIWHPSFPLPHLVAKSTVHWLPLLPPPCSRCSHCQRGRRPLACGSRRRAQSQRDRHHLEQWSPGAWSRWEL